MMRVLVTGGTGVLGRRVVRALAEAGVLPRVLSRAPGGAEGAEWCVADLGSGAGLAAALDGVETVVHCATTGGQGDAADDVGAARRLLVEAERAAVGHLVFPGIVGVERASFLPYYRARLEIEAMLAASGVPFTVQRATQFHELAAALLRRLSVGPVLLAPVGGALQPVGVDAVAARLARLALGAPAGRVRDLAGPDVLSVADLARGWLRARGERRPVVPLWPALGPLRLFTGGRLVSEHAERVGASWDAWVQAHGREVDPYTARGGAA